VVTDDSCLIVIAGTAAGKGRRNSPPGDLNGDQPASGSSDPRRDFQLGPCGIAKPVERVVSPVVEGFGVSTGSHSQLLPRDGAFNLEPAALAGRVRAVDKAEVEAIPIRQQDMFEVEPAASFGRWSVFGEGRRAVCRSRPEQVTEPDCQELVLGDVRVPCDAVLEQEWREKQFDVRSGLAVGGTPVLCSGTDP
jgi:hypothetical protein